MKKINTLTKGLAWKKLSILMAMSLFLSACSGRTYRTVFDFFDLDLGGSSATMSTSANAADLLEVLSVTALNNTLIQIKFDEPVDLTSGTLPGNYTIKDSNGVELLITSITRDPNDSSIIYVTTAPQQTGSNYTLTLNTGITGVDGSTLASGSVSTDFTGGTNVDILAPTVSSVSVPQIRKIDVQFNEEVEKSSAETTSNYALFTNSACSTSAGISISSASRDGGSFSLVHLTTSADLSASNYYLRVNAVADKWGNGTSNLCVSMNGFNAPAPEVAGIVSQSPASVLVTYTEDMLDEADLKTASNYTINSCNGGGSLDLSSATVSIVDSKTVLISGITTSGTVNNGNCTLTVTASANGIESALGVDLNSSKNTATLYYNTGDSTAPQIAGITPLSNTKVRVNFNEPIDNGTVSVSDFSFNNGLSASGVTCGPGPTTYTYCDVTTSAQSDTSYTLTVSGINDVNGNTVSSNSASFTGDAAPYITNIIPGDNGTIYVYYSEPVGPAGSVGTTDFTLTGADSSNLNITGAALYPSGTDPSNVIVLTTDPMGSQNYTLSINAPTGIQDSNGNEMNATVTDPTFAGDAKPTVTSASSSSPTALTINFSEPLNSASLSGGTYTISGACTGSGSITASSPTQTAPGVVSLVLTPTSAADGSCTVTVAGSLTDLNGNSMDTSANSATFTYTTSGTGDTTPPTVTGVVSGSSTTVLVYFSEPVDTTTGQDTANYSFSPSLSISGISCSGNVCTITTGSQSGVNYSIGIDNVQDTSGNAMASSYSGNFAGTDGGSGATFTLYQATLINATTLDLTFSAAVDPVTGENTAKYSIAPGTFTIASAARQSDNSVVRLTLNPGAYGTSNTFTATADTSIASTAGTTLSSSGNTATFSGVDSGPTVAPDLDSADDTGVSNSDNITSQTSNLTFTGTVQPYIVVSLYNGGSPVTSTTADTSGNYSFDISLGAGNHTLTIRTTDSVGNVSTDSPPLNLTIDTTAPTKPGSAPDLAAADDAGSSNTDNITNLTSGLTFTGTVEANATVEIFDGATSLGTVTADASGNYSIDVSLADGAHSLTVIQTDQAGNASPASDPINVTIDSTPPSAPSTALDLAAADDSGPSNSDNITNVTSNLTFTGTVGANETVKIYNGATVVGTGTADGSGNFSIDLNLSDGNYSLTYTTTDIAGNESAQSTSSLALTIDSSAPAKPSSPPDLAAADDTGVSNTDNQTSQTNNLTFTGTVEAGATVELFDGATSLGTVTADASGNYSFDISLTAGAHSLTVTATDSAGNTSPASDPVNVTVDTTPPSAPSAALDLDAADDSGASNSDNITNTTTGLTFSGTVGANETIKVYSGASVIGTTTADGSGNFSLDIDLTEGTYSLTFTTTDLAGNESGASPALALTVDTSASTISSSTLASSNLYMDITYNEGVYGGTGASAVDASDFTLTFAQNGGTATGATITSVTNTSGGALSGGETTIRVNMSITGTPDGNETISIASNASSVFDAAGNATTASTGSKTLNVSGVANITGSTLDSNNAYVDITFDEGVYTNTGASGGLTPTDFTLTFTQNSGNATAASISSVTNTSGGALSGGETTVRVNLSITGTPSGVETIEIKAATNEIYSATSQATPATETTGTITLNDKLAPNAPTGLDLAAADDSGSSNSDNVTNVTTNLTITGSAESGSTVELFDGASSLGTQTATGGTFSFDINLSAGSTHTITATATDAAGNVSAASTPLNITVDTSVPSVPAAPDLAAADDSGSSSTDNITNVTTNLTFSGTVEPNATVVVFVDGSAQTPSTQADGSGNWTYDLNLTAGATYSITITQTDLAGNLQSTPSSGLSVTIDTAAPAAPSGLDLASADDLGVSNTDNITSQTSALTISGTAEANATVTLNSDQDGNRGSTTADGSGNWSLDISLSANTHSITATATDAAGNTSGNSSALSITIDTTVPTITAAETLDTDNNGKLDHYKLTFSKNVNDSTFPGYALNALGSATTAWLIAGYTNVRLHHGTSVSFTTDTVNDNVLYLQFDELSAACTTTDQSGCDTGAKPDLTTTASPALQDTSGNTIAQVSTPAVTEADTANPVVVGVRPTSNTGVDVYYSEDIDQTTAETSTNYSGNNGLTISTATRDSSNSAIVHLVTSSQTLGQSYTVTVNTNVKDLANVALNSSAASGTFTGIVNPTVTGAAPQNTTTVRVTFSETITASTAECSNSSACSAIYSITGLPVTAAVSTAGSGTDSATFDLTTNAQVEGQNYTLTVTSGTAKSAASGAPIGSSGNTATFSGDGRPLATVNATLTATECPTPSNLPPSAPAATRVVVEYDQTVTGATALVTTNYKITGCPSNDCTSGTGAPNSNGANAVTDMGSNRYAVDFSQNFDTDQSQYQLTISGVQDANGNTVPSPTNLTFQCGTDTTAPVLISVTVVDDSTSNIQLLLQFSESVDQTTAETTSNYRFDTGAYGNNVQSATRQSNTSQVLLVTSTSLGQGGHQVRVINVQDTSTNAIVDNGTTNVQPFIINPQEGFVEGPWFTDPFADGTPAGILVKYNNLLYLGSNAASSLLFEVNYGLTQSQTIQLDADGSVGSPINDFSGYASTNSGTVEGIDALYAACVGGTSTPELMGSACSSAGGTEQLYIGALNLTGNYKSFWYTQDVSSSTTTFTFTEGQNPDPGGAYAYRSTVFVVFKDYLWNHYGAEAGGGGRGGRICVNPNGCLDPLAPNYLDGVRQRPQNFTRIGAGADASALDNGSNTSSCVAGDGVSTNRCLNAVNILYEYDSDTGSGSNESQLYMANGGMYFGTLGQARTTTSDGGIVRTKLAYSTKTQLPPDCSTWTGGCDAYWEDVTPDSNVKWNSYVSIPLPENSAVTGSANCSTSAIEMDCSLPYNIFVPSMKAIPYMRTAPNGDLYMLRNACSSQTVCVNGDATCDFRTERQVCPKGSEVPQLWMLPKVSSGSTPSGAGAWQLVAENGSTGKTNMAGNTSSCGTSPNKCLENSHLVLLEMVGNYLYIGYDNDQYGSNVWRTDMSAVASGSMPAESDFTMVNIPGIDGTATNQRIFSHVTVNESGQDWLIIVTRDGSSAMKLYRTANNQN